MNKLTWLVLPLYIYSGAAFARSQSEICVLTATKDGQTLTVHGKIEPEPHDLAFSIGGCEDRVVLTYAGDPDNDVTADQLRG
jgi:hypothetical protein